MSILPLSAPAPALPALRRLAALADLNTAEIARLHAAAAAGRAIAARRDFVIEGEAIGEPRIMLAGWACRTHMLRDGRRQVLGLVLPGDLIGVAVTAITPAPVAHASILAITDVLLCAAPLPLPDETGLAAAYAASAAADERHLLRQITRLGRLNAYERVADWLLEIRDRLALAGLADGGGFPLPLTQELIADTLGLTGVHVNRTLQALRSDGLLTLRGGQAELPDMGRLRALLG